MLSSSLINPILEFWSFENPAASAITADTPCLTKADGVVIVWDLSQQPNFVTLYDSDIVSLIAESRSPCKSSILPSSFKIF